MELTKLSIDIHIVAILIFMAMIGYFYILVSSNREFIEIRKQLKTFTPYFHILNAAVIYTGLIAMFFTHSFGFFNWLMLSTSILIMVLEIKRYKKLRVIKSTDIELQKEFIKFAKKIYIIDIALIISIAVLIKVI